MKFLFPKEFVTIFGLGQYPLQKTPFFFCLLLGKLLFFGLAKNGHEQFWK
jgi:hypothetical protein